MNTKPILVLAAVGFFIQGPVVENKQGLQFPTFEPFIISGRFGCTKSGDELPLEDLVAELRLKIPKSFEVLEKSRERFFAKFDSLEDSVQDRDEGDRKRNAFLSPTVPMHTWIWLMWLPEYVSYLQPLWGKPTWNALEVELASLVAQYLSVPETGMVVRFALGDDKNNRKSIERIVEFFNELIAEPHFFGAMMMPFLLPWGPVVGISLQLPPIENFVSQLDLSETLQLRLCKIPNPKEPYVLQGFENGDLCWSRHIFNSPSESIRVVEFSSRVPEDLGSYGWGVYLNIQSGGSAGRRLGYLVIDKNGEMLFYYLLF